MSTLVGSSEGSGPTTTIRHNWRIEVFSEFGDDPTIRAHREQVEFNNETGEKISVVKDRVVCRNFSELLSGPRDMILAVAALADTWELEDLANPPVQ